MKNEVEIKIKIAYNKTKTFISVTITGFRPGSIISEGRLFFANSSNEDVPALKETLLNYGTHTGKFQVSKFEEAAAGNEVDGNDDDGVNWWRIGVIISGVAVVFLLMVTIVLWVSVSIVQLVSFNRHVFDRFFSPVNYGHS